MAKQRTETETSVVTIEIERDTKHNVDGKQSFCFPEIFFSLIKKKVKRKRRRRGRLRRKQSETRKNRIGVLNHLCAVESYWGIMLER